MSCAMWCDSSPCDRGAVVSIRGLDQRNDQPPAGWPTHEQTIWRLPWEDGLEEYMEWRDWREPPLKLRKTQVVLDVTADREPASVDTWQPDGSPCIPPPEESPPAAQLPFSGASAGSHDRRP
jgi:hypothetical protein